MIKIRSYNARRAEIYGKELSTVDKMILMRSDPHTHTEFEFSELYRNVSASATMRAPYKCARRLKIDYTVHPERWDTICVPMTIEEEKRAWDLFTLGLEGMPYDLIGLLSTISKANIIKPSDKAVWCTETATLLLVAGIPVVKTWLDDLELPMELVPSQLDMLARHWWK